MAKFTHDPVRENILQEEQWFADLVGGMMRRSQHPTNVYSYNLMIKTYGEKEVDKITNDYEALREVAGLQKWDE